MRTRSRPVGLGRRGRLLTTWYTMLLTVDWLRRRRLRLWLRLRLRRLEWLSVDLSGGGMRTVRRSVIV